MQPAHATKREDIRYEVLQPATVEPMVQLIAAAFSAGDPPAVAMGLSEAELREFLDLLVPAALEQELTAVARSTDNKIVGALLSDDFAAPPQPDASQFSARFLPIFALLDSLDDRYRIGREIRRGEYLHLFMLAVDAQFSGRGIAQGLVESCLENGVRKGYRWAVTEATGVVSQRVFRKMGFEERYRVAYRDFTYEGAAVFASISGPDGVALMEKTMR